MSHDTECIWDMPNEFGRNDFTDRQGAVELKSRIEEYWRRRGFAVQVMLVEAPFTPAIRAARIDIRSDLVNGMPRMRAVEQDPPLRN